MHPLNARAKWKKAISRLPSCLLYINIHTYIYTYIYKTRVHTRVHVRIKYAIRVGVTVVKHRRQRVSPSTVAREEVS